MSGCLDNVSCDCWDAEAFQEWLKKSRNTFASIVSGVLFAIGWWIVIDATVDYSEPIYAAYFIPGVFSTIALLMINAISTQQITNDSYDDSCLGKRAARVWLFVGFFFAFGALVGGLWIFIESFLIPAVIHDNGSSSFPNGTMPINSTTPSPTPTVSPTGTPSTGAPSTGMPSNDPACFPCIWQGIAFFLQNLLIFFSTLVFKFGRSEEEEDSF